MTHGARVLLPELHDGLGRDQVARVGGHEAERLEKKKRKLEGKKKLFLTKFLW